MAILYFRAEGRAKMGLGHLIRSFALAKMLAPLFQVHFVINEDAPESIQSELKNSFTLSFARNDEAFLLILKRGDGVVLDGYHYPSSLQKKIKDIGATLVCIDDLHEKHFYADIIINQAIGISNRDYSAEPHTRYLFGPRYALLREHFLKKKGHKLGKAEQVFICFGGSDFNNITLKLLNVLEVVGRRLIVNVVMGPSYKYAEDIRRHAEASKHSIHVYRNLGPGEMASVIALSDIAFVPCSSTLLEVLSVGTTAVAGYYTDNQMDIYQSYLEHNLLIGIGDYNQVGQQQELICRLLEQDDLPAADAAGYFDGRSPVRLRKEFVRLFFPAWKKIRKAKQDDCELLFSWVNDPETRNNAIDQSEILWEDHVKWFGLQMLRKDSYLFIVEFNGIAIGQIRFDMKDNNWDITYAVAPAFRGIGMGDCIVAEGVKEMKASAVSAKFFRAFVREHNKASCIIFEKRGFLKTASVQIRGALFCQYQLPHIQ